MENITQENFKTEVLESSVPVLVDFYADWCGPCRALAPTLNELAEASDGRYKIVKVDSEINQELCVEYGVNLLPTLLLFKNGGVAQKLVGLQNKGKLIEVLGIP